jgi:MerR family transcriptional regulator, thiopeptide resistance regulator
MHVTRSLRVGEVASATGLTVRTLHHYDEIGLLVPSERSGAGYRLYGDGDLRRLYRILALRGMGFTLEEIASTLAREGEDPRPALRRHLIAAVEVERAAGTDPADPKLDPLVERWTGLIEQFTGGDPGIRASLQKMYDTEGPERASRGAVSADTMAYAMRAIEVRS